MEWYWLLMGYLFGSTPTGYLAVKLTRGEDIRDFGSGNIGATNVGRVLGRQWAIAVALFDMLKGGLAVGIARYAGVDDMLVLALVGLFGVLGHNFPVWLRFKGGKGVATSFGVLFFFHPAAAVCGGIVWYVTMRVTRYVSVASMFSLATAPVWLIVVAAPVPFVMVAALLDLLTIVRHRANVGRLLAGTENKVSLGRKKEEAPEAPLPEAPADPLPTPVEAVVVEKPVPPEPDEMEDFLPAWSECPETVEYEEEPPADESAAEAEAETVEEVGSEAAEGVEDEAVPEEPKEETPATEKAETEPAGKDAEQAPAEESVAAAPISSPEEEPVVAADPPAEKTAPRKRRRRKPKAPAEEAAAAPASEETAGQAASGEPAPKPAPKKRRRRKTASEEA